MPDVTFTETHANLQFSPTYPSLLVVPANISDNTLKFAGRYRSKVRLPALSYLHPVNNCSITRCSQPLVGVRQNRSIQDEKLLLSIFSTTTSRDILGEPSSTPPGSQTPRSSEGDVPTLTPESTFTDSEAVEDEIIANGAMADTEEKPQVYGAQQHNLIVDARPTVNAYAMQAVGMGTENMDHYPFATKVYLNIDNIHVMRQSLEKVVDALKESDLTPLGPSKEALAKSGWLKYISNMLDGVGIIARQIGIQHSHVVIHCSDGWDRTSQLSSLSQLCLDPYYRTLDGFIVLVEKDWLSFGHMFATRSGHLSSEKWFSMENERAGAETSGPGSVGGSNALEGAFLKAKGFFNKEHSKSRESLVDSDTEGNPMDPNYSSPKRATTPSGTGDAKHVTKVKDVSPIFHQFLDATYQLLYQYPTRFEFNERFLRRLLYHLYSCQYGTFLYNSERERQEASVSSRTRSVWDYFLSRRSQFLNPQYEATIDDHERGKERLIFPRPRETRWWNELFGREDSEMNGSTLPFSTTELQSDDAALSGGFDMPQSHPMALSGVETSDKALGPGAINPGAKSPLRSRSPVQPVKSIRPIEAPSQSAEPSSLSSSSPPLPARLSAPSSSSPANLAAMSDSGDPLGVMKSGVEILRSGVASLGLAKARASPARKEENVKNGDKELREMGRYEMEVEMQ